MPFTPEMRPHARASRAPTTSDPTRARALRHVGVVAALLLSALLAGGRGVREASATASIVQSWPGLTFDAPTSLVPPNPHGAAGPNGVLQVVNLRIAYFSKTGTMAWGPVTLPHGFFPNSATTGVSDPKALYEPNIGRFFVVVQENDDVNHHAYANVAVSKNSNPTSGGSSDWYTYRFEVTEHEGAASYGIDTPSIGYDRYYLYLTYNMVDFPVTSGAGTVHNAQAIAMLKQSITTGTLNQDAAFTPLDGIPDVAASLQPVSVLDSSNPGPAYFIELPPYHVAAPRLWVKQGSTMLAAALILTPGNYGQCAPAPQPSPGLRLGGFDTRAMGNAFWMNGAIWTCQTAGGDGPTTPGHGIVYVYKINTNGYPSGTPTLAEFDPIDAGTAVWNTFPAIGGNAKGDVCLIFTQSSATLAPRIMYTTRTACASGFDTPALLKASATYYNGQAINGQPLNTRWGDYGTVAADPVDGTFWVSHEYAANTTSNEWHTWWGNLQIPFVRPTGWACNGTALSIASTSTNSVGVRTVPDGAGGAFVAWSDNRNGSYDVFLQRVDATGNTVAGWPTDGVPVCTATGDQANLRLISDGAQGAFVCWQDPRTDAGDIYVQRITAAGAVSSGWPSNGAIVCGATGGQSYPNLVADTYGGAIVTWQDSRNGTIDIYAQRMTSGGGRFWSPSDGVVVSSASGDQLFPVPLQDGAGSAIIAWSNFNGGTNAQRLNFWGAPLWAANGVTLTTSSDAAVATDAAGGAFVAYSGSSNGLDVFVQHVNGSGTLWASPSQLCSASGNQYWPTIVADGSSGALVEWSDFRDDLLNPDFYVTRITASGARATGWPVNGAVIVNGTGQRLIPSMIADGNGGAIVTWDDTRPIDQCSGGCNTNIYVQRITPAGTVDPHLPANGTLLCDAAGSQKAPTVALASANLAIVAWSDQRDKPLPVDCPLGCANAVYAQKLDFDGTRPAAITDVNVSSAAHWSVALNWTAPGDDGSVGTAATFDIRRSTAPITEATFAASTPVTPVPSVGPAGTTYCIEYDNQPACSQLYYAIKTEDECHNWSALSNVAPAQTTCSGNTYAICDGFATRPAREEPWPALLELSRPTPNPASGPVEISFGIPANLAGAPCELAAFDVVGRRLDVIERSSATPGRHVATWSLRDGEGVPVRNGVYYLRLSIGSIRRTTTVLVTR